MRGAVLHAPNTPFVIEDLALEDPRAGEVLVRVAAAGVCRSDHHVAQGGTEHPVPVVCGHEGAGVVEAVGHGVGRVRVGDRVVLSWAPSCGTCFYCRMSLPAHCETHTQAVWAGTMMDGTTRLSLRGRPVFHYCALATFAEAAVVPESCCVVLRGDVPLEAAALVGCSVTTGVGAALFRAQVKPGSTAAVFGCGGVGMNVIQGAALCGADRIIAVDVNPSRLGASRRFGATHAVNSTERDPVEAVRDLTGGRGADYTFEAIGLPSTMMQAVESARPAGTIVLVGLGAHSERIHLGAGSFTRSDKVLTSAYYGMSDPQRDMPRILDLCAAGRLKIGDLIGRRRPLAEINEAFADMLSGDLIRTVLVPG